MYSYEYKISTLRRITIFTSIFFISGLFYLPIWYDNSFSLDWLTAARPTEQGLIGIFSRFFYKIFLAIGLIQLILIFVTFLRSKIIILNFYKNKVIFFVILLNTLLFLYIPAELSYLQPAIIFLYFFITKYFDKRTIYLIIFLNFFSWLINYNFLEIKYKSYEICASKEAISARVKFTLERGAYKNFLETRKMIECWAYDTYEERSKKILSGKALK